MENRIMENEEVIETVEEMTVERSVNGRKLAIIAVTVLGGYMLIKKVVKPMIRKRKAKKEQAETYTVIEGSATECVDSDDESKYE